MFHRNLVLLTLLAGAALFAGASDVPQQHAKLSASEIVDRNIAARGGLQSWRAVKTMLMSGKMEAGGNSRPALPTPVPRGAEAMPPSRPTEQVKLPFVMELKRPRKERIEIDFKGQKAVQVFDGSNGWKLRPYLNRKSVEPYTPEEMKTVSLQSELDGPLVDYAAKGTKVELDGIEKVEDRDAYNLKLTLKGGEVTHLWIDAQTFLEVKISGIPRRLDGKYRPVEVYYRDYRALGSIKVPFLLETRVLNAFDVPGTKNSSTVTEKIVIEKVEVNPTLDDALFTKAQLENPVGDKQAATPASYSHP